MSKSEGQKIYNSIKTNTINLRKDISLSESKSGQMRLNFMSKKYMLDHMDLIEFMGSKKMQELMKSKIPENSKGYVEVFVMKSGKTFDPFGVTFMPYFIISKYWGLGYKNTNPKEYVFFECLYQNDESIFRGCFKK